MPGAPDGHSVPNPPHVVSYLSARLFSTSHRHNKGTSVNHHRRSPGLSRGLLGGYLCQTLRTMLKEMHLPTRVEETWDVAWWTYIWRGMLANHHGSSNHFVF
jgi:hypothetical protein